MGFEAGEVSCKVCIGVQDLRFEVRRLLLRRRLLILSSFSEAPFCKHQWHRIVLPAAN